MSRRDYHWLNDPVEPDPDTTERWERNTDSDGITHISRDELQELAAALERAEQERGDLKFWLSAAQEEAHELRTALERIEAEAREWKRDFESALARNVGDGWFKPTDEERRMILTALGDVWLIQPDDEPNPHAATLLFRKLSTTERSGCGYHAPADVHGCAACDTKRIATEQSGDE